MTRAPRWRRFLTPVAILTVLWPHTAHGAQTATPPAQSVLPIGVEPLLENLRPSEPRGYFEAAERLMQTEANSTESTVALRRTTQEALVIGLELWLAGPSRLDDQRLGPSILLTLAELETDPLSERSRWLRVLAAAMDSEGLVGAESGSSGTSSDGESRSEAEVIDVLSALELLRAGEGRRASRLLERPGVYEVLQAHERLLHPAGITGEADRIRKLANDWPVCVQCRNRRSIKDSQGVYLCPTCRGDPGPPISSMELLYQLRLEATLLSGAQQSWVSQTLVDGGRPLRDLDAAEVAPTLNVDPLLSIRRGGRWVAPSPAPGAQPKAAPDNPATNGVNPGPASQPSAIRAN